MRRIIISISSILLSIVFTSLSACAGGNRGESDSSSAQQVDMTGYESVPMPEIPSSLTAPEDRAEYLLKHFWDALDFSSVSVAKDSIFLEQSFSNFASVLPLVNAGVKSEAVDVLMKRASANKKAYEFMADTAEKYLWQSDSPFYSEASFLPFAEYYVANDSDRRDRAMAIKQEIAMNAPGSVAPDFRMEDTQGNSTTLYTLLGETPVILMFYQPDCDHCHEAIDILKESAPFMKSVSDGSFRFVPLYIGGDKELWLSHAATLPQSWSVMIDEEETIDNEDLYLIKATPSFYVIDGNRRIMLKDGTLQSLFSLLAR